MKAIDLRKMLANLPDDAEILLSSDEEWNNLYSELIIDQDAESKSYVLFATTSSLVEE